MPTWALYLDETGDTRGHSLPLKQGQTPVFTLGGVALPLYLWREFDREYLYLKREFFQQEIDKSSKDDTAWEAKGNNLIAPRNAASERNKIFTYRVLDKIKEFDGKIFSVNFLKSARDPISSVSIYTKALQIMAERFDIFLRENNAKGVIIIDSRMAHTKKGSGLDYSVAKSYLSFIFGNEQGRQLKQIIEAPLFADSALTAGLQVADIVAALIYADIYQHRISPDGENKECGFVDYRHVKRHGKLLNELEFKSQKKYDSRQIFGHRTLDHRDHIASQQEIQKLRNKFHK